jgi:outer membrane protein assembly factor BamB
MFRILLVAAVALALTNPAQAEDWTEFRGPTGQGNSTEKNLPAEFGPTKNVAWKVEVPGVGWSSPVILKKRIYLTAAVPQGDDSADGQSLRVLCLDADDGSTIWNVQAFEQSNGRYTRIHRKNTHASSTPITDGKHLYVHFGTHGTACLTLAGKIVWKTTELVYAPNHGNGGSPVIVDDLLIVSCDGSDIDYVAALDRSNGKLRWKTSRPQVPNPRKFSFTTPLVIEVAGKKQLISSGTDIVAAYEPATGKEIWRVTYDGYSVVPRPIFGHGLVYVCTGWSPPKLLAIRPNGTGDVTESHVAWKIPRGVPNTPSTILVGDELYFISDRGVITCVDAKSGESHWTKRVGGGFSASPVYADGKIYFQSEQGEAIVIKPGLKYEELARNQFPGERTLASYAIADSSLFIRTGTSLYRIQEQ